MKRFNLKSQYNFLDDFVTLLSLLFPLFIDILELRISEKTFNLIFAEYKLFYKIIHPPDIFWHFSIDRAMRKFLRS